ncbi:hypothetical protein ACEUZ9_004072 [Paracoccus litorisediminis]|uniref:hypothetical protein n=1 Tax=Paracoccus litorisediminis TaxID=2006130 RepID=UPI0037349C36
MVIRTQDAPSGITLSLSDGGVRMLSLSELGEIGNRFSIPADLYLDVEAEMLGEEIDMQAAGRIQKHLTVAAEAGNWGLVQSVGDSQLALMSLALTLRLQAANRLCLEPFMESLMRDAMVQGSMLMRMAEHFTSADLSWSGEDDQFIFDPEAARLALTSVM